MIFNYTGVTATILLLIFSFSAFAQPSNSSQYLTQNAKWRYQFPIWADSGLFVKKLVLQAAGDSLLVSKGSNGKVGYRLASSLSSGWSLTGNSTNTGKLGTTNNRGFTLLSNGLRAGYVDSTQNWGIGPNKPLSRLYVTGSGVFNSPTAARSSIFNSTALSTWHHLVDDGGTYYITDNGYTNKFIMDPGTNGAISLNCGTSSITLNGTGGAFTSNITTTNFAGSGNNNFTTNVCIGGIIPTDSRIHLVSRDNLLNGFNSTIFKTVSSDPNNFNYEGSALVIHDSGYSSTPGYANIFQTYGLSGTAGTALGNNSYVGNTTSSVPDTNSVANGYLRFELGPVWPQSEKMRIQNSGDVIMGWTKVNNYTASQTGTTITSTVGNFSASDVGRYFMWSTYNGGGTASFSDKITAYTNPSTITVERSRTILSQAGRVVSANILFENDGNAKITGNVGIGTSPSAKLHAVSTTEQLRLGYDASNYYTTTVNGGGAVSYDATGSSFTFRKLLVGTTTQSNTIGTGYFQDGNGYSVHRIDATGNYNIDVSNGAAYFNAFRLSFGPNAPILLTPHGTGGVGIGTTPTAKLHIAAGTATASTAPVKLTKGPLNTTPEAGTYEYDSSQYMTNEAVNRFALGGKIKDFVSQVNNSGTGETDLYTYTTKANSLASTGEELTFSFSGSFDDATATSTLKVYFAGQAIATTSALAITGPWHATGTITRINATDIETTVSIVLSNGVTFIENNTTTAVTFTGTNILKITGTAGGGTGGSNDIVAKRGSVSWSGAANN